MPTTTTVICLMNAADGTIAFDRYKNDMPRLINARVSKAAPTLTMYMAQKYNMVITEYPDFTWAPNPSVRVCFCSIDCDDTASAQIMQQNFWCMTIDNLKDDINFENWGYPLKMKGIQGNIYRFRDFLLPEQARPFPEPLAEPLEGLDTPAVVANGSSRAAAIAVTN